MEKKDDIVLSIKLILLIIVIYLIGYYKGRNKTEERNVNNIEVFDTIYNNVILDSIKYKIDIKDSTIVKLKKEVKYEMEQAINADDSNAIKQFYELVGAN